MCKNPWDICTKGVEAALQQSWYLNLIFRVDIIFADKARWRNKILFLSWGQTRRESPLLCIPVKTIRTLAYFARRMRRSLDILCGIMSPWSGNNLTWGDETAKRNKSVDERLWLKNVTGPKEKQNSNCGTRSLGSVETDIVERGDVLFWGYWSVDIQGKEAGDGSLQEEFGFK